MPKILDILFGDPNKKVLHALQKDVARIGSFEEALKALSDAELRGKTQEFKDRLAAGASIDDLVFEAFAVVREAGRRVLGQRHYDVQLMGGLVMFRGGIAEMRTGEGKTLTATAPLYANALLGKGGHLVTVNDYLAKRDCVWMGQIFHALGVSVGCIAHESGYVYDPLFKHEPGSEEASEHDAERDAKGSFLVHMDYLRPVSRREAYQVDITYGTNNEFGFDYLRDNMVGTLDQMVMRDLQFAIVDEIDSILIDEARTPLIISAPAEESNEMYTRFAGIMRGLQENTHYNVDEKMRASTLTEEGIAAIEKALGVENLYAAGDGALQHYAESALRAHALFKKDVNYVVQNGEVVIVDEFTGRLMPGRRYSEGLHQAIEAKEGVAIQRESQTLATITFQNYFRMYQKLGGMTGTAATEAEEFSKIYKLEVTVIPTNKETQRVDHIDRVYKTELGKFQAVVREIKEQHAKGQPVLVGTVSIDKNQILGAMLAREGIPFKLLNAKNHEEEGAVIAQAGRPGAVTIATNMAGRGVDIMLGGTPPTKEDQQNVLDMGGLYVIGTERHESRRIDNQLRGRAGRQGDAGETRFFVSLEDDVMRIFGSDRVRTAMNLLKVPEDVPIENGMVSKALEKAQQRVEGHHFDTRKHLLEYDDVLNKHREVIYKRRREVLEAYAIEDPESLKGRLMDILEGEVEQVVLFHTGDLETPPSGEVAVANDTKEIAEVVETMIPLTDAQKTTLRAMTVGVARAKLQAAEERTKLIEAIMGMVHEAYTTLEKEANDRQLIKHIERAVIVRAIDTLWIDHLAAMGALRTGIGLRGYGQRDPLIEYKKESYGMFQELLSSINQEIANNFFKMAGHALKQRAQYLEAKSLLDRQGVAMQGAPKTMGESGVTPAKSSSAPAAPAANTTPSPKDPEGRPPLSPLVDLNKIGRNDPCPCGSGRKFKKCHGVNRA